MPHTQDEKERREAKEFRHRRNMYNEYRRAVFVCEQCSDLVKSRKLCHWGKATFGYGNIDCPVVFVGEAPGRDGCAYTGIPFTRDRSGKLYNWVLNFIGLKLEDVYTTNIVKCWPADKSGKNRTPTNSEANACIPHLLNELRIVKPRKIIALGRVPEQILLRYRIDHKEPRLQVPIQYVRHPAYILRQGGVPDSELARNYSKVFLSILGIKMPDGHFSKKLTDFI